MSLKKFLLAFAIVIAYFSFNYAFLSDQSYDSMKDYIETTKNEFSYEVENIIYEDEWTGFHIKMISGEWLDKKKVKDVEWSHYVDIVIPNETLTETAIMFIDGGDKDETYFRLDTVSVSYTHLTLPTICSV